MQFLESTKHKISGSLKKKMIIVFTFYFETFIIKRHVAEEKNIT